MPTAQDVLRIAAAELGTIESPAGSNRQKYSAALGRPAEPWCADFVVWVARQAGLKLQSESAYTPSMANAFKATRTWHTDTVPRPGDLAFFNFGAGIIRHVGIVAGWDAHAGVTCIEGNTSPGTAGSQDNGGGVYRRTRPRYHIVGFGRPYYSAPAAPPPAPAPTPLEIDMQLQILNYWVPLDGDGNGWIKVPVAIDKIVGALPQGLRPGADGKYASCDVTFAEEDGATIVSVIGWVPGGQALVRLRVVS